MTNETNFLRLYRKSSPLTLTDIAYLMKLKDNSTLSRYERCNRIPNIEFLIFYHLLFNKSIEAFYELHVESAKADLCERIDRFLKEKRKDLGASLPAIKKDFLTSVLNRLSN